MSFTDLITVVIQTENDVAYFAVSIAVRHSREEVIHTLTKGADFQIQKVVFSKLTCVNCRLVARIRFHLNPKHRDVLIKANRLQESCIPFSRFLIDFLIVPVRIRLFKFSGKSASQIQSSKRQEDKQTCCVLVRTRFVVRGSAD